MPWLETSPVEERIQFIDDALSDRFTMSELCARYGISRRVGYKWLARYEERKDDGDSAIEAELLTTVRTASMVTSQNSSASFGDSIPSGERESFCVFSLPEIPE